MRMTKEPSQNSQLDIMNVIAEFQEQYENVYWNQIDGEIFIYRPLGRLEYKQLIAAEISDIEKENVACQACLLYPINYDFDNCAAGIPTELTKLILKNSFLDAFESKQLIVAYHRKEMEEFDNQITCIINEAFPNFDIEEIENWDMTKTAKYLSRAEWKLNVLRNIPIDYELSDQYMAVEWNKQHGFETETEESNNEQVKQPVKEDKVVRETVEERQARMAKAPKKASSEEIAKMKAMFPEIDWESSMDPNVDFDNMGDSVDTESPALRPGW